MRKVLSVALLVIISCMASAQTKIYLTVGDKSMTATLVDNSATRTLVSILSNADISVDMSEYGGFEMVGALPESLPTTNTQITTVPGDIMLYQGRNIVIFYGSNTWSYTRLGKIDNATASNIREFLGSGSAVVTISLSSHSGIDEINADNNSLDKVYDLKGNIVTARPLSPGLYIIGNKKELIR